MSLVSDKTVLYLLIANAVISLVILLYGVIRYAIIKKSPRKTVFILIGVTSFLCPYVVLFIYALIKLLSYITKEKELDMSDISFQKEREKAIEEPNMDVELNFTALAEAQNFSESVELRKLIMNTIKLQPDKLSKPMRNLIDHPDTEASHYAAVAVGDSINEFQAKAVELMYKLQNEPYDRAVNRQLVLLYIKELNRDILSFNEKKKYIYAAEEALSLLQTNSEDSMLPSFCAWMVQKFLDINEREGAERWLKYMELAMPDELETYKTRLRFFYATKQSARFHECLNQFCTTSIAADSEMLEILRFYQ